MRPRVHTINENNPSIGASAISLALTSSEDGDTVEKVPFRPKLPSVFKRIKPRLYFFTSDAILLIPGNRVSIKGARHPLER